MTMSYFAFRGITVVSFFFTRTWINEMMAVITVEELPRDVSGAESLVKSHKEHKIEIDNKLSDFK